MRRHISAALLSLALLGPLVPALAAQAREAPRAPQRPPAARGWLGISFSPADPGERRVVVHDVLPGSPAERAGVQEGDTIVRWQGRADVGRAMQEQRPRSGERVQLRVRRGGRERDLAVVAAARPPGPMVLRRGEDREVVLLPGMEREIRILADSLAVRADSLHHRLWIMLRDSLGHRLRELESFPTPEMRAQMREIERTFGRELGPSGVLLGAGVGGRAVAGAEFADLNPELASYFGTERGVLVLRVAPGTPAERSGLKPGDVVVELDDRAVRSVPDVRRGVVQAQRRDRREVELKVLRRGKSQEIRLRW